MEAITSLAVLEDRIRKAPILIAEFGTAGCGPCLALQKKLESWQSRHPCIPCLYIPLGGCPEICGQMGIFSAPALLVYVQGKLAIREAGCFSLEEVLSKVEFYESILT